MNQNIDFLSCLIPIGLAWLVHEWHWKHHSSVTGCAKKLVTWLLGSTLSIAVIITMILGVIYFLASFYVFFSYDDLVQKKLLRPYYLVFWISIAFEGVMVFLARHFMMRAKELDIIEF